MRIGSNPNGNKTINLNDAAHRVIIPIYIPNNEGYFKDSFNVLKVCIESLLCTINKDTVVSLISNGSTKEVNDYLTNLYMMHYRNIYEGSSVRFNEFSSENVVVSKEDLYKKLKDNDFYIK